MLDFLKNQTIYRNKYRTDSEAIVISCFFNPQNSPYRLKSFNTFYETIRHLDHRIIECVIGDASPQLPENANIRRLYTKHLLWHKESLLNNIIRSLPKKYKYVFWVDADVLFTNQKWLTEGVGALQTSNIIQPFSYCVHLDKDQLKPSFGVISEQDLPRLDYRELYRMNAWRSFCYNYAKGIYWQSEDYNEHGHVGFAWGARREILDAMPLYDRALIGGADHIIAHAAAGQVPHTCIMKSFTDNIDEVNEWSNRFAKVVNKKVGYVPGALYHIWHGDIMKREYYQRIKDFTARSRNIHEQDENGLYTSGSEDDRYMRDYFDRREVTEESINRYAIEQQIRRELHHKYPYKDDKFMESLVYAYMTDSVWMGMVMGGNLSGAIVGEMLNDSDKRAEEVEQSHADSNYEPSSSDTSATDSDSTLHAGHTHSDSHNHSHDATVAGAAAAAIHLNDAINNNTEETIHNPFS